MTKTIDIDHPAVGAGHVFVPGSADSLVAATRLLATAPWPGWVTVGREHRLPVLLERPLTETAVEIWCLGYCGTGNPLLPPALEAHVTHRHVHWLSTTTGRLSLGAAELPGIRLDSIPGGSLVNLVLRRRRGRWTPDDHASERLGFIFGRYPGVDPSRRELALANRIQAASVAVRNHEGRGPALIRELAETPVAGWNDLEGLSQLAAMGEEIIAEGRKALVGLAPRFGAAQAGPALWVIPSGRVGRGVHGKAVAAESWRRKAPAAMVELVERGVTKAWIVLPARRENLWHVVAECFAGYTSDFSWTGRRGAGSVHTDDVDRFVAALWTAIRRH